MPLHISERDAVRILANRIGHDGDGGLQNFARHVLGAHSEQAKRLAAYALAVSQGEVALERLDLPEAESIQVTREVDGRELSLTLKADKLPITSYDELVEFYEIDTDTWKPTSQIFNFWGNETSPNFQVKAAFKRDEYQAASAEDREAFRTWAAQYAPASPPEQPAQPLGGKMLEIVVADLHVDRVGYRDHALTTLGQGVRSLLHKSEALYGKVDQAHLVFLGDTFNSDNLRDTTTSGTPQQSENDWRETFRATREAIANLAMHTRLYAAEVFIHILPGNHDFERSYYLADSLWAYFDTTPYIHVVVDDSPRRYLKWGSSLIGLTHGDRVKPGDLAMTMFREADTRDREFLEWHLGHTHTRREDELHGITFQWFRSPQVPSEWEHKNLYNHNRKEITGIVWDRHDGPVDTFRYAFRSSQ